MKPGNKHQDDKPQATNPKARNFGQPDVSGQSENTQGKKQQDERLQDDYDATNRNFDHTDVSGDANE